MQTQTITMIVDDGPFSGWEFVASRNEHDIDAMDDLYTIELWPPDANQPAHNFATYRHAYGWTVINAALAGEDEQMQAALDWWTEHHTTTPYQIHQILIAIDETTSGSAPTTSNPEPPTATPSPRPNGTGSSPGGTNALPPTSHSPPPATTSSTPTTNPPPTPASAASPPHSPPTSQKLSPPLRRPARRSPRSTTSPHRRRKAAP